MLLTKKTMKTTTKTTTLRRQWRRRGNDDDEDRDGGWTGGRRRGFSELGVFKIPTFGTRTCPLMISHELAARFKVSLQSSRVTFGGTCKSPRTHDGKFRPLRRITAVMESKNTSKTVDTKTRRIPKGARR
ncbi:hypothetical protein DMN91_001581 [Ooceraea biroi]|uniref:Uncharacterized protein n=1 Tax=Ooceraea biroi TaxID=2015173 RepID=A0A3L8DZ81_OOCBI|nr:uncharacterized protein LOC105281644 [Ooceraea biroi]RLU25425.1 hypothetical protein DMN91_001581 [Ooceraea biroi]